MDHAGQHPFFGKTGNLFSACGTDPSADSGTYGNPAESAGGRCSLFCDGGAVLQKHDETTGNGRIGDKTAQNVRTENE